MDRRGQARANVVKNTKIVIPWASQDFQAAVHVSTDDGRSRRNFVPILQTMLADQGADTKMSDNVLGAIGTETISRSLS